MEEMRIEFFVPGIPKPAGSKSAFYNKKLGRIMVTDACKESKPWKQAVAYECINSYKGDLLFGPVELSATFLMPRPKNHFKTGKNAMQLKDSAPVWHTVKPDRTKLLRGVEDALTGILWRDDAQVVNGVIMKVYGDKPGVKIIVETL